MGLRSSKPPHSPRGGVNAVGAPSAPRRLERSDSHDRMTAFLAESRQTITLLSQEITEESDCDINIYVTAPPAAGAKQFCETFQELTEGRFRFAAPSLVPPHAVTTPSDRTRTRHGQIEGIRKHALVDIGTNWSAAQVHDDCRHFDPKECARQLAHAREHSDLSDAARLKFEADLSEFDLLQQIEEGARPRDGKFRFRVIEGSVLDASTIPIQTAKRVDMLSTIAQASLELTGTGTWERWTRTAPISSSLFVYIKYDDAAFAASYTAYCARRDILEDEKNMLNTLRGFYEEQKASYDKVYYDGSPAAVCGSVFVYVLCCPTAAITQPAHAQFMIQEILKTVQALQRVPGVWGARSSAAERAEYLRTPGWVSGRIKTVPCNLFGGSFVSPHTAARRRSLDESRSSSSPGDAAPRVIRSSSLELVRNLKT